MTHDEAVEYLQPVFDAYPLAEDARDRLTTALTYGPAYNRIARERIGDVRRALGWIDKATTDDERRSASDQAARWMWDALDRVRPGKVLT